MIAVVRIKGQVGLNSGIKETLDRLKIRRKFATKVFENPTAVEIGMIQSVRNFVSFGEISEDTYKKLVEVRGQKDKEGNLKPFFRLHPPRGGANMKLHYPKGLLGENKEIDKLILRML